MLWKLHCGTASHALNYFIQTFLHAGVHPKESLVRFKAPSLRYTIKDGPSLGLFLDIPLLPCVMEVLKTWDCRTVPPHLQMRWTLGKTWCWAWTVVVLNPPALHSPPGHGSERSSIVLSNSLLAAMHKGWSQFSDFHILRSPELLSYTYTFKGQLYYVAQMRCRVTIHSAVGNEGRTSTPALVASRSALPPASRIYWGVGVYLSPDYVGTWQMSKGAALPCSQLRGWFTSPVVLPRRGAGPTFPSAAAGKGKGQLPCPTQVAGSRLKVWGGWGVRGRVPSFTLISA